MVSNVKNNYSLFDNFFMFIASVRELILHAYGKNKQDIKSLKIVVERWDWYKNFSFFM